MEHESTLSAGPTKTAPRTPAVCPLSAFICSPVLRIPESDGVIEAARQHPGAVGREDRTDHVSRMAAELAQNLSGSHVPHPDVLLVGRRQDAAAIGERMPRRRKYHVTRRVEGLDDCPALKIGQLDSPTRLGRRGQDDIGRRAKRRRLAPGRSGRDGRWFLLAGVDVPDSDALVFASRKNILAVRRETARPFTAPTWPTNDRIS